MPAAPAPSATVFAPSTSRPMASSTARSGTTSTSVSRRRTISNGTSPMSRTAMPSAIVGAADRNRPAGEALRHRRVGLDLDAIDRDAGLHRRRGDQAAGDQAAAADRNDQSVQIGRILQHFQRQRALAGDHRRGHRTGG